VNEGSQYLLGLYEAERERSAPIPTGMLAERLDRSPAATTEMLQRLDERGLVTYEPYRGATLTEEGRATAKQLFENYRVLARFFREVLDLEEYEEDARRVACTLSPQVTTRLAETLLADDDGPSGTAPFLF
jgi:DtxR family Mn-dependent transcriptional regulator